MTRCMYDTCGTAQHAHTQPGVDSSSREFTGCEQLKDDWWDCRSEAVLVASKITCITFVSEAEAQLSSRSPSCDCFLGAGGFFQDFPTSMPPFAASSREQQSDSICWYQDEFYTAPLLSITEHMWCCQTVWEVVSIVVVFVLQEGEGKMAPPSSPSQSTQASVKCQRRTSSMLLLTWPASPGAPALVHMNLSCFSAMASCG